jgi:Domain of Unknown Function (DUF349)
MENLSFIDQLKELTGTEDVLAAGKDVNELRTKFEDYVLEEERKVQVAELEAQEKEDKDSASTDARKTEIAKEKDDFYEVYQAFKEKKKNLIDERNAKESTNLGTKQAIIKRLKEVVTSEENIGAAFGAFKEIQEQWKEVGDIPRNNRNEIQTEYSRLLEDFFYNIKIYKELKDHDFHRNQQLKSALIEELKKLNDIKSIKEVETKLKKLQNDWDEIGPVPNEEWESLKESYWTEVRSIYNKINRFYDDKRAQSLVFLQEKQALLEETRVIASEIEELDSVKGWDAKAKKIIEVQAKWKTIGFGPKKENEAIWKEFRAVCDTFFDAKKAFFSTVHEKYDGIAAKKKALIDRANSLKESTEWKDTADKLKRLQQDWKKLGHAGIKHEQKLWKEFRAVCDSFFNSRSDHFSAQDKEFEDNLKLKQELLKTIEAYKPAKEKKDAIADLKKFSADFNTIGRVPMKAKDAIFKAFKIAMDKLYSDLKMEGAEKDQILFEAKIETFKASPNASRLLSDMKFDLRKEIDKQTKEITQLENNLGFFANSKGADSLKKEVEKKVDKAKEKIADIKSKLKMIPNE